MVKETQPDNKVVPATIILAGRPYLLKVNAADEGVIHRLAGELNEKIALFQRANHSRDKQDCLALTLLTYAAALQRASGAAATQDIAPATRPGM